MEKVRQSAPIPSLLQEKRDSVSLSPTKTSLTRHSPVARSLRQSVELRGGEGVDAEVRRREEILEECIRDQKKKIFYRTLDER